MQVQKSLRGHQSQKCELQINFRDTRTLTFSDNHFNIGRPPFSRLSMMGSREALDGPKTPGLEASQPFFNLNELHTKDAYLVFRALCKLGMKPLGVER